MSKRTTPQKTYAAGHFSQPMRDGFPPRFSPQIVVDPKTKRFETDYARQQRIRESSGWTAINWASFGKIK